ncbi:hypothetical protein SDC9_117865 [bioreactor metagenome]|uniref:Esterase n=1 Tax=bioreactor metagenome TaxID=1076179 RepID=A0A645C8L5_9ZZZZ
MATLKCYYSSFNVGFPVPFTAIIPQKKHVVCAASPQIQKGSFKSSYPVLFLLHDETDSPTEWMKQTRLEKYANEKGIIIIMPEAKRSFYTEYEVRDKAGLHHDTEVTFLQTFTEGIWDEYIGHELVGYVREILPVSKEKNETFIGGVGMGGFGALKLGMKYSDVFGAVFSLSGLMDLQWAMDNIAEKKEQFETIFGSLKVSEGSYDDFPFIMKVNVSNGQMPRFYHSCAAENDMYSVSNKLLNHKAKEILTDYKYSEDNAVLDWDYLDSKIKDVLDWLM